MRAATSPAAARRKTAGQRPPDEVVSFGEYESLYRHTWGDPEIRWILSTLPTAMIFDDHDIRDDWNTSAAWRKEVNAKPWWRDRIRAGLASYWVYQHLGNLSPAESADDDYQSLLTEGDTWPHLSDLADRADKEVDGDKGLRFSYRWDLGRSRLIMVDSRNARILDSGERMMLGDREFKWLEDQADDGLDELDHLMLGSSLPWLLPPAIGDLQTVNESHADRSGSRGELAEKSASSRLRALGGVPAIVPAARRTISVPHTVRQRARHRVGALRRRPPQLRRTRGGAPGRPSAQVHQLVCSPVHNYVPMFVKPVFKLSWSSRAAAVSPGGGRVTVASPDLPIAGAT